MRRCVRDEREPSYAALLIPIASIRPSRATGDGGGSHAGVESFA